MKKILCLIMIVGLIIGCATAPIQTTSSGKPEVSIISEDVSSIKNAIINEWMSVGYSIESETDHRLLMTKHLEGGKAIFAQALIGNSYSTTPKVECDFNIYSHNGVTRVIVSPYISTQMAMGQIKREPMHKNGDVFNNLYKRLIKIKNDIESQQK